MSTDTSFSSNVGAIMLRAKFEIMIIRIMRCGLMHMDVIQEHLVHRRLEHVTMGDRH